MAFKRLKTKIRQTEQLENKTTSQSKIEMRNLTMSGKFYPQIQTAVLEQTVNFLFSYFFIFQRLDNVLQNNFN